MLDGHGLGDHAAHGVAHDVGRVDAECGEEAEGVIGESAQRVRRVDVDGFEAGASRQEGIEIDGDPVELGRQADVAVVESDYVTTLDRPASCRTRAPT